MLWLLLSCHDKPPPLIEGEIPSHVADTGPTKPGDVGDGGDGAAADTATGGDPGGDPGDTAGDAPAEITDCPGMTAPDWSPPDHAGPPAHDTADAPLCETVDPDVPEGMVAPDGWYLERFATGLGEPTNLHGGSDGYLYVSAGAESSGARSVLRFAPDGSMSASDPLSDPDGVSEDSAGAPYAAGSTTITALGSFDGEVNSARHSLSGVNINDLAIDRLRDDFYVAVDDGRVIRVAADGAQATLGGWGECPGLAVDGGGDLWIQSWSAGPLYRVASGTDAVEEVADFRALVPGFAVINAIAVGPDGAIYMTLYITDTPDNRVSIGRWHPDEPGVVDEWVRQVALAGENNPYGLSFLPADGCLYWAAVYEGHIFRACPC